MSVNLHDMCYIVLTNVLAPRPQSRNQPFRMLQPSAVLDVLIII
jgi:hypothetical protein